MPLTLNVGLSRKVGLPEFSSIGASCGVAVELDSALGMLGRIFANDVAYDFFCVDLFTPRRELV